MPTTSTTSANGTKRSAKAARKTGAAKAAAARRNGSGSASRGRARAKTTVNTRGADRAAGAIGEYAERAVLIQVGAALAARERVVSGVSGTVSRYSSTSKAKAQLRRFERRGATARSRLEREVRKVRVRVERELRLRRKDLEKTVTGFDEHRENVAKNSTELAGRVQERILNLV